MIITKRELAQKMSTTKSKPNELASKTYTHIRCGKCNRFGHHHDKCTTSKKKKYNGGYYGNSPPKNDKQATEWATEQDQY